VIHGCENINGCNDLTTALGHKFGEDMICRNQKWLTAGRVEGRYTLSYTKAEKERRNAGEKVKRRYTVRWIPSNTYDETTECGAHWSDHRRNPVPCQWPKSLGPVVRYADVPLQRGAA
jgi:hypothetical protein